MTRRAPALNDLALIDKKIIEKGSAAAERRTGVKYSRERL